MRGRTPSVMISSAPPQIPGYLLPRNSDDENSIKDAVAQLLERHNTRFPGAQPVSFARQHLAELHKQEYFMCEKTDGLRCLLFLHFRQLPNGGFEPLTFLIDRKNNYYEIQPPLKIPHHTDPPDASKFLFGTILDGELVNDRVSGQPQPQLVYYVFDCLAIDGNNKTDRTLDKRLGAFKAFLWKPYNWLKEHHPHVLANNVFKLREKTTYPSYHTSSVFEHILPNLPHGNDGLIFTCKDTPYVSGTDDHILKWKPPHENTIDFKLRLGNFPEFDPQDGEGGPIEDWDAMPDRFILLVSHGGKDYQPFQHDLYVTEEEWQMFKGLDQRLDGRIIECYRDEQGRWRFKKEDDGTPRWRDDKKDANHISTVNSVLESIEDPVTERDLIAAEASVRAAVKRLQARAVGNAPAEPDQKKRKFSEFNGVHPQ